MTDASSPDLCVIGGGHAGLAVARRAAARGMKVVVVEPGPLGGAGRLADRVPAAMLSAAGTRAKLLRTADDFGLAAAEPKVSLRALHNRLTALTKDMQRDDAEERCAALGIEIVSEAGRFTDRRTFMAGEHSIRAGAFVLAVDPEPIVPDIAGLRQVPFFTARTIGGNARKLSHLLVIGAGATGLAVAQAYRRLGSAVTVVETAKALHDQDPEFVAILLGQLRQEGIDIREETAIAAIQKRGQGIGVVLDGPKGEARLDISHILVAAGSAVDIAALDIGKAGSRQRQGGQLAVGSDLRTSNRAIFAIGAAAGMPHARGIELAAEVVVENAQGGRRRLPPEFVPRFVGTDPMIAEVGLTEPMARARLKQNYRVVRCSFGEIDAARAAGLSGNARLILDSGDTLVGAALIGPDIAELAALFSLAVANRLTIPQLANFAPPAGSLAEIVPLLAARATEGRPANKARSGIARWLPLPGRIL
jgi:pyruvate/2-oxoglutarate dehydrogenase complex dihydrolipoamide dehydrogenase (E3) component